jgi:hypothetical protein
MDLKGHRLWAMGQLDSTCRAPPLDEPTGTLHGEFRRSGCGGHGQRRGVALQVAFRKANFETGFYHLIGYRLWV